MSASLKELLQLPEPKQSARSDQAEQYRRMFTDGMKDLNHSLQVAAAQASPADYQPLDAQRRKLYEAYQMASSLNGPTDDARRDQSVQRVVAAMKSVEDRAAALAAGVTAGLEEWQKHETAFENAMQQIAELEEAQNPKAPVLRKLGDAIRSRANNRQYQQASTALEQIQPKLGEIFAHHQQMSRNGNTLGSAPAASPPQGSGDASPAGALAGERPGAASSDQEVQILEDRRRNFKQARAAWTAVKTQAECDLEKVKEGARQEYMADADQFPKIVQGCKAIDEILDNLDDDLRDTLDQYVSTPVKNQTKLTALASQATEILDRYLKFVANNSLMKAIDMKEFADVTMHAPVMKALGDLKKALT